MHGPFLALQHAADCFRAGRISEAEQICRQVVAAEPDYADAWHLLGVIGLQSGKYEVAVENLERSVALAPQDAAAWNNLGIAVKNGGKLQRAVECFRQAVICQPDFAEGYYNLANVLRAKGRIEEAIPAYRRAIELQPSYAEWNYNLGTIYQQAERHEEAIACYGRALEINPNHAEAHSNLGTIFKREQNYGDAARHFRRALELQPQNVEMHFNWACILLAQDKLSEAEALFERILTTHPDHAESHLNRAVIRLLAGDFERGWPEYEWRWKTQQQRPRDFAQPLWDGQPLQGHTILLWAEQAFGDAFQFVRYAEVVKKQNPNATVMMECLRPLKALLATCKGVDRLVAQGDELPPFDVHSPLLTLPGIFKTRLDSIPANVPYLFADPTLIEVWRERLAKVAGFRIGVHWQGRAGKGDFRKRDIPIAHFSRLALVPGVQLISLQKGTNLEELSQVGIIEPGLEWDTTAGAFMDTAAIMKNVDLVISSDTSVPHLAGALDVPVWLALPFVPDWRWLLDRSDSPWYPTMRLFRQKQAGDWSGVFEEMDAALRERIITRA